VVDPSALCARLDSVRDRIARAASRAGRTPSSVRLIAVSKTFSAEHIRAVAAAGQVDFGENKVQEAQRKMAELQDLPIRWHFIGHLQSNKAKKAGELFHVIHAIDERQLLDPIDRGAAQAGRAVELLVQVDLAREATKHGLGPEGLSPLFEAAQRCQSVRLVGLMLLPPAVEDPEQVRPYFTALRRLRDDLILQGVPNASLNELSMGMSHDFEIAVEEGATMVRVGSAIFGARTYP
jgi:pyridoxal phosphate enzyme (YggS family)